MINLFDDAMPFTDAIKAASSKYAKAANTDEMVAALREEQAARLIFADWLAERGPSAASAVWEETQRHQAVVLDKVIAEYRDEPSQRLTLEIRGKHIERST